MNHGRNRAFETIARRSVLNWTYQLMDLYLAFGYSRQLLHRGALLL